MLGRSGRAGAFRWEDTTRALNLEVVSEVSGMGGALAGAWCEPRGLHGRHNGSSCLGSSVIGSPDGQCRTCFDFSTDGAHSSLTAARASVVVPVGVRGHGGADPALTGDGTAG